MAKVVWGVLVTVLAVFAFRFGSNAWAYIDVPWDTFASPDRQFTVKMVGKPERSERAAYAGGTTLPTVRLLSRYRDHAYIVEYMEFPGIIPDERTFPLLHEAMGDILRCHKAKLQFGDRTYVSGVNAIAFRADFPEQPGWSAGTLSGHLFFHRNRLYAAYGFVPKGELFTFDIDSFRASLRLAN